MVCKKPEHIKDEVWDQHLRWLGLVSNECKSNQLKRGREKRREESRSRNPGDKSCSQWVNEAGSSPGVGADLNRYGGQRPSARYLLRF